ncbi:3D domain-containing protein [Paenibacillus sp. VCA1]|uniref:3D domain-containing protein n=1 Tax=Paenibacillus sp. VCA1 TaxID=3039148 RepID=UPI002870CAFF|nr:3D domain-containing protein [Paenibacillus sp. VCA1]MDR9852922.1 3D domain-containing protein [Paenibacillus sp. VCA1]
MPPNNAKEAPTSSAVKAPARTEPSGETGSSDETGNHRPSSDNHRKSPPQKWRTFTATAYTAFCDTGCIGVTSTGIDVSHTIKYKGRRIVAVDPAVIPLGTELTIRLADGSEIEAIAEDTGGAIKGRKIDVLMSSARDAWDFGRQTVEVRIDATSGEINK